MQNLHSNKNKEAVFNLLYATTRDAVFHYLKHYTADMQLIEDLMQEAYVKIWDRLDTIRDLEHALPLVKVYTRNLLIDHVRRRVKEDWQWLETLQDEAAGTSEDYLTVQDRKKLEILDLAIDRLPEKCRQVYLYHRDEQLSYKEIAQRLSLSISMVEKYMSKAIRLLRKEILEDPCLLLLAASVLYPAMDMYL